MRRARTESRADATSRRESTYEGMLRMRSVSGECCCAATVEDSDNEDPRDVGVGPSATAVNDGAMRVCTFVLAAALRRRRMPAMQSRIQRRCMGRTQARTIVGVHAASGAWDSTFVALYAAM